MRLNRTSWMIMSQLAMGLSPLMGADPMRYHLRVTEPAQRLAQVRAQFPPTDRPEFAVQLPVWRTGRYEVLPLANGIRRFQAQGTDGRPLVVRKTDKSTWLIEKNAGEPVTVEYELFANELELRTRHIDDTHAYLNASAVWVYHPELRQHPIEITLEVPAGWQSRSGMTKTAEHTFVAPDYDVLTDSPIETGLHEFREFEAGGKKYELAVWGAGNYDVGKMVEDIQRITATVGEIFGSYPFERYLFIVHAVNGGGGATEHLNSTVLQWPRWNFAPRKEYLKFARLITHEFFHTWNVKGYRPAGLVPYDYQRENYSDLLWIVEGHTSYFDNLLTLRAGAQTRDEYLEELARLTEDYLRQPGRFVQSAAEGSFDEWIQPSGEQARNSSVDIYSKGEMLGLTLDLLLRSGTQGETGLESAHRKLWEKHPVAAGGYTAKDVKQILGEVMEHDWEGFWRDYVAGTKELPLKELLRAAGLELRPDAEKEEMGSPDAWWGLRVREGGADQFALVTEVERDGPAWKAGIASQDMLAALDGLRVSAKDFAGRSVALTNGPVRVSFFRRDELREVTVTPELREKGKRKLKAVAEVSDEQKRVNTSWLATPWPE